MGPFSFLWRSAPATTPVAALPPVPATVDQADSCGPVDPGNVSLYAYGDWLQLDRAAVEFIYERNKLAARIVDLMPEDMASTPASSTASGSAMRSTRSTGACRPPMRWRS